MSRREGSLLKRRPAVDPLEDRPMLSGGAGYFHGQPPPAEMALAFATAPAPAFDARPIVALRMLDIPHDPSDKSAMAMARPDLLAGLPTSFSNAGPAPAPMPAPRQDFLRALLDAATTLSGTRGGSESPQVGGNALGNLDGAGGAIAALPPGPLRDALMASAPSPSTPASSSSTASPEDSPAASIPGGPPWPGFAPRALATVAALLGSPLPFDQFRPGDPLPGFFFFHGHQDGNNPPGDNSGGPASPPSSSPSTSQPGDSAPTTDAHIWLAPWGPSQSASGRSGDDAVAKDGRSAPRGRSDEPAPGLLQTMDGDAPAAPAPAQAQARPAVVRAARLRARGPLRMAQPKPSRPDAEAAPSEPTAATGRDRPGEVPPAVGSDLRADFPAGDGDADALGAAVDRFLERLPGLGEALARSDADADEAAARPSWPAVWAAALMGLEIGRRVAGRRNRDDDEAEGPTTPRTHDPLTGWPGSWSARVP